MATIIEQQALLEEEHAIAETTSLQKPASPPQKLTLEQANKLAAGRPFELIKGRMVFKMPDYPHAKAQSRLCGKLVNYFEANPIGQVLTELTHRLWPDNPNEGRLPDLSVILNENIREEERYPSRAPDLAVEIVSRDDAWADLFEKAELYFEKGSRIVWFVDPFQKCVVVVTPNDRQWVKDTLTCPQLLPGFSIDVQDIFTWPSSPAKRTQ